MVRVRLSDSAHQTLVCLDHSRRKVLRIQYSLFESIDTIMLKGDAILRHRHFCVWPQNKKRVRNLSISISKECRTSRTPIFVYFNHRSWISNQVNMERDGWP